MSNLKAVQEKSKQSATAARESAKRQAHPWRMKVAVFVGSLVFLASLSSWWKQYREESASRETPPAQEAQVQTEQAAPSPAQEAPVAQRVTTQLTLKEDEWVKVIAYQGQCTGFRIPPGATVTVQAQESNDSAWVDWDKKTFPISTALRFKGTAVTIIQWPTEEDGTCS